MKNKLTDLNDYLFLQLERLDNEELEGEKLAEEIKRSQAVASVAREIIDNGRLVLSAQKALAGGELRGSPAALLGLDHKTNGAA